MSVITRTPGVPQISVRSCSFSSSIMRLRPKSAIIMSASSFFVRNSKFSGFKSVMVDINERVFNNVSEKPRNTSVYNAALMNVLDSLEHGAHKVGGITVAPFSNAFHDR